MSPEEQVKRINLTRILHANLREEGFLDVCADFAPALVDPATAGNWESCFVGVKLRNVILQVNFLSDRHLRFLGDALRLEILNLHGNSSITGEFLEALPAAIGLRSMDIALTGINDAQIPRLLKFDTLRTVWCHANQFSDAQLLLASLSRPDIDFRPIY